MTFILRGHYKLHKATCVGTTDGVIQKTSFHGHPCLFQQDNDNSEHHIIVSL